MKKIALSILVLSAMVACETKTPENEKLTDSIPVVDSLPEVDTNAIKEVEQGAQQLEQDTKETSEDVDSLLKGI
jgi:hypothetical protein